MEKIREYIRKGEIEKAINKLLEKYSDSAYSNELFLLSSQYQTNARNNRLGIKTERYESTKNEVIYALLGLIKTIEKQSPSGIDLKLHQKELKKILIVESNPLENNLFSNIEIREIDKILFPNKSKLELKIEFGSSLQNLINKLNEESPNIVHITAFANDIGIYFHDKSDNPILIENQTILSHLELIEKKIDCFLFNTFISEELAKEISNKGSFVIGYNGLISSNDTIDFANGFYNTISYHKDYKTAFKIGCQTISSDNKKDTLSKIFGYDKGEKVQ